MTDFPLTQKKWERGRDTTSDPESSEREGDRGGEEGCYGSTSSLAELLVWKLTEKGEKYQHHKDLHWLKFSFFTDDTVCLVLGWRAASITSSVDALTSRWRAQTWYLYLWQMWSELGACRPHSWRPERETESKRGFGNQTHAPRCQTLQLLLCQSDYSRITRR